MKFVEAKCPNCSANLEFSSESQNFGCKDCESAFTSQQLSEIYPQKEEHKLNITEPEKTAEDLEQEKLFSECSSLYTCPSCGAAVVTEETTSATQCVYCLSPVILTGRLSGE